LGREQSTIRETQILLLKLLRKKQIILAFLTSPTEQAKAVSFIPPATHTNFGDYSFLEN
jgi:hypothetical protein